MSWGTGTKNPHTLYEDGEPRGFLLDPGVGRRIARAMTEHDQRVSLPPIDDEFPEVDTEPAETEPPPETPQQRRLRHSRQSEPTDQTVAILRVHIYAIAEGFVGEPTPSVEALWRTFSAAKKDGQPGKLKIAATTLAIGVLLELEQLRRAAAAAAGER